VGDELWRIRADRFSAIDMNWSGIAPPDAVPPQVSNAPSPPQTPVPDCAEGSIIECQNQVLREAIELAGVPSNLHYSSSRVPGRTAERALAPQLSGPTLPASLSGIEVDIQIAGQRYRRSFTPQPDLVMSPPFVWDGRDGYGRPVQGAHEATVRVDYVYGGIFYQLPADNDQSFGVPTGVAV
jgi:hypothetical protein